MKKYRYVSLLLAFLFVFLCSCSKREVKPVPVYSLPKDLSTLKTGTVIENDRFEMGWDNDNCAVAVLDKKSRHTWSTTPYEFLKNPTSNELYVKNGLRSGIIVTYYSEEKKGISEVYSYSKAEYVLAKKIKNGLLITYYFDSLEFSVPISFTLEEDGISVSLEISLIAEGANKVISVSVAPFLASCRNQADSYVFVPSGSGALMMADEKRTTRYYDEPVYGSDPTAQEPYQNSVAEDVRMPVFGVKDSDAGAFAVITSGSEFARIRASVGDSQYGYSGAYCDFAVRDKSVSYLKTKEGTNNEVIKYSDGLVSLSRATVRYWFTEVDRADYNGMAAIYRNYLNEKYPTKAVDTPNAFLNVLGAYYVKESTMGVSHQTLTSLTTCDQAEKILSVLKEKTGASYAINLKGFTESGLDYGKVGGNFKVAGICGGNSGLNNLQAYVEKANGVLSLDFDLLNFSQSGSGFSDRESATTVNGTRAIVYDYYFNIHSQNTAGRKAFLANREQLAKSTKMIAEKISGLKLHAVAFSTLSNTAYSDHRSQNYYGRGHMSDDAASIITKVKKENIKTVGTAANAYAAVYLDYIFGTPSASSGYYDLDKDIPFYQMVFKGRTALSTEPINLAADERNEFLKAVSVGASLGFTVCDHTGDRLYTTVHSAAAVGVWDGISDSVCGYIKEAKPFLDLVKNTEINQVTIDGNLTKTVFTNGTVVFVNFGSKPLQTGLGTVEARSFIYG